MPYFRKDFFSVLVVGCASRTNTYIYSIQNHLFSMMRPDFFVYLEEKDTTSDLGKKILHDLFVKPILNKKPRIVFLGGSSGEGKSYGVLKIMELLVGVEFFEQNFEKMNVLTPLEYSEKIGPLLHDPDPLLNLIAFHESRDLVRAKLWYSFSAQVVADVTQQSRTVKPLCFFMVSQFLTDVTAEVRRSINFYGKFYRPLGRPSRLYLKATWYDDRDLENVRLRKRRIRGVLVYPSGKRVVYSPEYIELGKPSLATRRKFNQLEKKAKDEILRKKMERLDKEMRVQMGVEESPDEKLGEWLAEDPARLAEITSVRAGKYILNKDYCERHRIDKKMKKNIELRINRGANESVQT